MQYRTLGYSDVKVSVIGLGGLHFGVFLDENEASQLIHVAHSHGINFLDTAPMYGSGKSETIIGKAIKDKRHSFVIGSKVGLTPIVNEQGQFGVKTVPLAEKTIIESVEMSLRALQTDYIDLLQLHAFDATVPMDKTLSALEKLKSSGKIRAFGCSNYNKDEMEKACNEQVKCDVSPFASLQTHYNMLERRFERDLLPYCSKYNMGVLCYRALSRGILSDKYKIDEKIPENSRAAVSGRVRQLLKNETLKLVQHLNDFAKERSISTGVLSLSWLLSRPTVSSVVLGMRNEAQLLENIRSVDCKLSGSDMIAIDKIIEKNGMLQSVLTDPSTFLET